MGYIPKRRHGQPSYAPIISSEGRSGLSLGMDLRAGNVHASKEAWAFLQSNPEQTAFLHCIQPHARATGWSFLQQGDHRTPRPRTTGLCGCSQDDPTVEKKDGGRSIRTVRPRLGGSRVHLYTLSLERRTPVRRGTKTCGFGDRRISNSGLFTFKRYTYHQALVTNLELTARGSLALLLQPGVQELLLREFKDSYAMAKIPTRSFSANAAYMEILLWAYDLVLAIPILCLPKQVQHWNISTLRRELWWLPAEWVKRGKSQRLGAASQVSASGPVPQNSAGFRKSQTHYLNRFATILIVFPSWKAGS